MLCCQSFPHIVISRTQLRAITPQIWLCIYTVRGFRRICQILIIFHIWANINEPNAKKTALRPSYLTQDISVLTSVLIHGLKTYIDMNVWLQLMQLIQLMLPILLPPALPLDACCVPVARLQSLVDQTARAEPPLQPEPDWAQLSHYCIPTMQSDLKPDSVAATESTVSIAHLILEGKPGTNIEYEIGESNLIHFWPNAPSLASPQIWLK